MGNRHVHAAASALRGGEGDDDELCHLRFLFHITKASLEGLERPEKDCGSEKIPVDDIDKLSQYIWEYNSALRDVFFEATLTSQRTGRINLKEFKKAIDPDEQIARLRRELAAKTDAEAKARDSISVVNKNAAEFHDMFVECKESLKEMESTIEELKSSVASKEKELDGARAEINSKVEENLACLENEAELRKKISELDNEFKTAGDKIGELLEDRRDLITENARLKHRLKISREPRRKDQTTTPATTRAAEILDAADKMEDIGELKIATTELGKIIEDLGRDANEELEKALDSARKEAEESVRKSVEETMWSLKEEVEYSEALRLEDAQLSNEQVKKLEATIDKLRAKQPAKRDRHIAELRAQLREQSELLLRLYNGVKRVVDRQKVK